MKNTIAEDLIFPIAAAGLLAHEICELAINQQFGEPFDASKLNQLQIKSALVDDFVKVIARIIEEIEVQWPDGGLHTIVK